MPILDDKQWQLIQSWIGLAGQAGIDAYTQFIALWIAFNAYCYAYYGWDAQRPRADLRKDAGLAGVSSEPHRVDATIQRKDDRIIIELAIPTTVRIHITERYTEDHIYTSFAEHQDATYANLRKDPVFFAAVKALQSAITKNGHSYVVNMLKAEEYDPARGFRDMVAKHIIIPFDDDTNLTRLKNLLYQVRCNIFHGAKIPGEANDDRIVRASVPVLRQLLHALIAQKTHEEGRLAARPEGRADSC